MSELVHEFLMVDSFGWTMQQILDEALVAAQRQGDMMGYEAHRVELATDMPGKKDGAICWPIKVYGRIYQEGEYENDSYYCPHDFVGHGPCDSCRSRNGS